MRVKTLLSLAFVAGVLAACATLSQQDSVSDTQIGLRKVALNDELELSLPEFEFSKQAAGESQNIERAFENAPPLIPHDIEGLLPITKDMNACIDCHMPEVAKDAGATSIPRSHLVDLRTGKDLNGELNRARFNCTQCHVPQANAKPLVENSFTPVFRVQKNKNSSNLLDVLNEGVK